MGVYDIIGTGDTEEVTQPDGEKNEVDAADIYSGISPGFAYAAYGLISCFHSIAAVYIGVMYRR